ncbi:MAG: serine hydrolase [Chloroflexota bacterium]
MRNRSASILVRIVSILFLSGTLILTIVSLIDYSRQRNNYPAGMTIGGVPVGGVDPQTASERVLQVYNTPIEAQYAGAVIHIDPSVIGFELELEAMLAAADLARTSDSFWGGFWNYLWNRDSAPVAVPLRALIAEERLRAYLQSEIAPRYDIPPEPAQPVPGGGFTAGRPGQELDIDRAVILIEDALRSPTNRSVSLTFQRSAPARPTIENLEILLKQTILASDFDGLTSLYLLDLQTGQEIHFILNQGQELETEPDVAITASSTIKIPILVSIMIKNGLKPLDERTAGMITNMIKKSENPPSDALMAELDVTRGPLVVTEDMKKIGLTNTFLAGFFEFGSPLLARITTPANQRLDVYTDPDLYNQTTASDMGMLLADIYQCATSGGGALAAAFPDRINQASCQQMVTFLAEDKIGVLLEAGVPGGTQVAHKHGWVVDTTTGYMKNVSDAAIIYTPGGNYVLTVYTYHPQQIIFDNANLLFANLAQITYNFYNLSSQ